MEESEQILIKNVYDVQLINVDQLYPKNRQKIFWIKGFNHSFNTFPTDIVKGTNIVEGRPAIFYSHKDSMFLEVFIDCIVRINIGGLVFWHEIEIKIASS